MFFSDSSQFTVILKNLNYGKSIENLAIASKNQAIGAEDPAIEPKNQAIETAINKMNANKTTRKKQWLYSKHMAMKVFLAEAILLRWLQHHIHQQES